MLAMPGAVLPPFDTCTIGIDDDDEVQASHRQHDVSRLEQREGIRYALVEDLHVIEMEWVWKPTWLDRIVLSSDEKDTSADAPEEVVVKICGLQYRSVLGFDPRNSGWFQLRPGPSDRPERAIAGQAQCVVVTSRDSPNDLSAGVQSSEHVGVIEVHNDRAVGQRIETMQKTIA